MCEISCIAIGFVAGVGVMTAIGFIGMVITTKKLIKKTAEMPEVKRRCGDNARPEESK